MRGLRVGPPEISVGKKFWPVQKPIMERWPTWGERGYGEKFSHWETVDFFDTKKEAQAFIDEEQK